MDIEEVSSLDEYISDSDSNSELSLTEDEDYVLKGKDPDLQLQIIAPQKDCPGKRLVVRRYEGATLIDLREFYEKQGMEFPSKKGITLNLDMWEELLRQIHKINQAIHFVECGPTTKCLKSIKSLPFKNNED